MTELEKTKQITDDLPTVPALRTEAGQVQLSSDSEPSKHLINMKVGHALFKSGLFPNAKNEYGAFAIITYGDELGIKPMTALQQMSIIQGKLACNSQLLLALMNNYGWRHFQAESNDKLCVLDFYKGDSDQKQTITYTIEDAQRAGLANKPNWTAHTTDMLFWRCVSRAQRRLEPACAQGLMSVEEATQGEYTRVTTTAKVASMDGPGPVKETEPIDVGCVPEPNPVDLSKAETGDAADHQGHELEPELHDYVAPKSGDCCVVCGHHATNADVHHPQEPKPKKKRTKKEPPPDDIPVDPETQRPALINKITALEAAKCADGKAVRAGRESNLDGVLDLTAAKIEHLPAHIEWLEAQEDVKQ